MLASTADDPGGLVAAAVVLGGVGALLQAGLGPRAVDLNLTMNIGNTISRENLSILFLFYCSLTLPRP